MMKWKNTGLLVGVAAALFVFIFLYERHTGTTQPPVTAPPRLLPRLQAAQTTAAQVRLTNLVVRAERRGDSWWLTAPLSYPGAPVAVERLLTALQNALAAVQISPREMSSRGQKAADFGLDAPQATVVLEQGADRQELQFGAQTTAGDQVYVQLVGLPGISLAEAALLELLPRSLNDWRNLALFEPSDASLDRLEVVKANGGMYLQRDPTNLIWQLSRPRLRADQIKVESLLDKIHQARVIRFVSDDPKADLDSYGLLPPQMELLLGSGSNAIQRVQFGKSPPNDPVQLYARRLQQTNIVLVPKALLDLLQTPAAEYRDRRLLAFPPASITLVEVRSDEPFTLRRQTNDTWLTGENTPADEPYIRDWLYRLSQLQVAEFVKDVVTDFSSYGLAPPRWQYLLKTSVTNAAGVTNVVVAEVHFGSNTLEKAFVRRADEDSVYTARYLDCYHMPTAAWQLHDHRVWNFTTNQVLRVTLRQAGRTRVLVRSGSGVWDLAPGSQGRIEPLAVEEMLFRLGDLEASMWVGRGAENLPRFGFAETNLQIAVEIKAGDKTQTLTLDFGGPSPTRFPYAAAQVDGQVWIFEFPWGLYQYLAPAFGLPLTGETPPASKRDTSRFETPARTVWDAQRPMENGSGGAHPVLADSPSS
jgi:hypothetical protein